MRIAVISGIPHHRDAGGRLCTLDPVVHQLDRWAALFDEMIVCAPLDPGPPPAGFAAYEARNVSIRPVREAGGNTRSAKLGLIGHVVPWAVATRRLAREVDAVHLRCPSNIGAVAIFSTIGTGSRRFALYAGAWRDYPGEPTSFRLQRRLLSSRRFAGPVHMYGEADPSRPHLEPFFSPSFTAGDWDAAAAGAADKVARIADDSSQGPLRLVTVGRLTPNKNQLTAIEGLALVLARGVDATLDIYGDGPCRQDLERRALEADVAGRIRFHGTVDHQRVMEAFAGADLNLLSTRQEGFGKVLIEGMAHATVPLLGSGPVAQQIAGSGTRGIVFDPEDPVELADAVSALLADRDRWASMARAARDYAGTLTLEVFQSRVKETLERQWGVVLGPPATVGPGSPVEVDRR